MEAVNGLDFLRILPGKKNVDLVLMDIRMPIMDGIKATDTALKKYPNLRILALSIHSDREKIQQMIDAGALGFLLKGGDKSGIREAAFAILRGETYDNDYVNFKI